MELLAERLRGQAKGLAAKIKAKEDVDMAQNITPRRVSQIELRLYEALWMRRQQNALHALADAHEDGSIDPLLAEIKQRTQVKTLLNYEAYPSGEAKLERQLDRANIWPHIYKEARQSLLGLAIGPDDERFTRLQRAELRVADSRRIDGFYPTPPDIVALMLRAANIQPGMRVLEPSAGRGDIADAIRHHHPDAELDLFEIADPLRTILDLKGHNLVGDDFLYAGLFGPLYDRIVMNPPFARSQDILHVEYALRCLKPGGRLVAIMSEGTFFRTTQLAKTFRQFIEPIFWTQKLKQGAFKSAGTRVATRLVVIDKKED